MSNLKKYAELIALRIGQPFNEMLVESLKTSIKYYRAMFIRQDIEKNGEERSYFQYYVDDLIKVDSIDDCLVSSDCIVLRTKNKIPTPIRIKSPEMFNYAGTADRKSAFTFKAFTAQTYQKYAKYTSGIVTYDYVNGYIYVYTKSKKLMKYIGIGHQFANPEDIINNCGDTEINCFDEGDILLNDEMVPRIVNSIMNGELKMILDDKEIGVEKPVIQNQSDNE
jgi:hypothetical protein